MKRILSFGIIFSVVIFFASALSFTLAQKSYADLVLNGGDACGQSRVDGDINCSGTNTTGQCLDTSNGGQECEKKCLNGDENLPSYVNCNNVNNNVGTAQNNRCCGTNTTGDKCHVTGSIIGGIGQEFACVAAQNTCLNGGDTCNPDGSQKCCGSNTTGKCDVSPLDVSITTCTKKSVNGGEYLAPSQNCNNGVSAACTGTNTIPAPGGGQCVARSGPPIIGGIGTIYVCKSSQSCANGGDICDNDAGPKCCGTNTTGNCVTDQSNATVTRCQTPQQAQQQNYPVIPPPPSPPCTNYDTAGRCTSTITALGGLETDPGQFVSRIFGILIGLSGGIAVILIIIAGYRFMMSQGKPESIQQAREQLIAAIVGLIFLIFSLVILEVIGVDILQIPGTASTPSGGNPGGTVNNPPPPPPQNTAVCTGQLGGQCILSGNCATAGGTSQGQQDCGAGNECCTAGNGSGGNPPPPGGGSGTTSCTQTAGACQKPGFCTPGGTNFGKLDCLAGQTCCE